MVFRSVYFLVIACACVDARGSRCRHREDVHGTDLVVVNCYGAVQGTVTAMHHGPYHFEHNHLQWTSRDRSMDIVTARLPCNPRSKGQLARCLHVPLFYVFCYDMNATTIAAVGDQDFPDEPLRDIVAQCSAANTSVVELPRIKAVNIVEVEQLRAVRERADMIAMICILVVVFCCCCSECERNKRYSRV